MKSRQTSARKTLVIYYFCVTISILFSFSLSLSLFLQLKEIRLYLLIAHFYSLFANCRSSSRDPRTFFAILNRIPFYVLKPQLSPRFSTPVAHFSPTFFLTSFPSHNSHSRMAEQRGTFVPSLLANVETTPSAHCRLSFASANFRFLRAISTVIPSSPASRRVRSSKSVRRVSGLANADVTGGN